MEYLLTLFAVVTIVLLWDVYKQLRHLNEKLEEWRYEWGQRTPEIQSHAAMMAELYREE